MQQNVLLCCKHIWYRYSNQITASIFIVSHHIVLLTYISGIENNFLCYKSILIIYHQHLFLAIRADLFLTIIDISLVVNTIGWYNQALFWIFQLTLIGENGNGNIAHCNWCWCFHSSAILIIIHRCRNGACTCLYHNWVDILYCIRTHHHRPGHQIYKPTCSPWIFLIFWYFCEVSHIPSCRD